jgi:hypothetical protein
MPAFIRLGGPLAAAGHFCNSIQPTTLKEDWISPVMKMNRGNNYVSWCSKIVIACVAKNSLHEFVWKIDWNNLKIV